MYYSLSCSFQVTRPNIVLRLWWCAARLGNPGSATTSAARNLRSTISIYTEGTILLGVLMCNFALFDDSFFLHVISVPTLTGDWLTVVLVTVVVVVSVVTMLAGCAYCFKYINLFHPTPSNIHSITKVYSQLMSIDLVTRKRGISATFFIFITCLFTMIKPWFYLIYRMVWVT